jgi:hypothetical protein
MFPGCFYLIGMWYRRKEAQKRYSFFFSSTTLAGAFGGLIAAGIGRINGAAGYAAWRWMCVFQSTADDSALTKTTALSSKVSSPSPWH